jgi:Zn-dependent peptidase ImmA (M78 family)
MTISELRQLLSVWQNRLGLGVWKIKVKWGFVDGAHGHVSFDVLHRTAEIHINKPSKLPDPIKVEYVLVHELLHLVLVELELVEKAKPDTKEMVLERVVNQLTNAFLERNKQ